VKSDVFLRIWDRFRAEGIEMAFPQRDLHLKTPPEIRIVARSAGGEPPASRGGPEPRLELVTP
jgi:small-conductance mechanosensitive channel